MDHTTLTQKQITWCGEIETRWCTEISSKLWHLDSGFTALGGEAAAVLRSTLTEITAWLNALILDHPTTIHSLNYSVKYAENSENGLTEGGNEAVVNAASTHPWMNNGHLLKSVHSIMFLWAEMPVSWADLRLMWAQLMDDIILVSQEIGSPFDNYEKAEIWLNLLTSAVADIRVEHMETQLAERGDETLFSQHLAGRFLANASHEIRTPLTAVLGFSELLMEKTYGELNSEQLTALGHIENSAQNLLEIINNLLDLLHIRAGKLVQQYRSQDCTPLLSDIYKILLPLANRKSVEFTINLANNLGIIETDESIFRHIVYHLLASTLRATPARGNVSISAKRINDEIIITTHDTALHLPPETLPNMMMPYPLLENVPARGYEGWEVGLPLVMRYIELLQGTMKIESVPGEGTQFFITLPAVRPAISHSVMTDK